MHLCVILSREKGVRRSYKTFHAFILEPLYKLSIIRTTLKMGTKIIIQSHLARRRYNGLITTQVEVLKGN